ncbi:hypothetical protein QBC37DRAFT_428996 [Rhypophila decipiens]|uniref:Uncharacterized protein n=1 Tax=Rhypophila decipiens TaxID=261697 RepID=A0AAN7B2H7_9PEZI|nr:hypothetical protein QBC37DRAFT_428996 [Rhypophila decipiens]
MTFLLVRRSSLPVIRGCRSYQRPGVTIGPKIDVQALEPYAPSHPTKGQMQSSPSPPIGITSAEYTQEAMTTRWQPLPNTHDGTEETRLVMIFTTRDPRARWANQEAQTPFVFVPCQLDISPCEGLSEQLGLSRTGHGKLECVGLPGDIVRAVLSGPLPLWHGTAVRDELGVSHFDDEDPWAFSRCIMADFSGMGSEEAALLSREGRLGCWASVTLTRQASGRWDLGFLIHRLVVSVDR